jgi:acetyl-CoA acetyltransferase
MAFPKREAAVAGVYLTEQGKLPHRTGISLGLEAFQGALNDAGLTPKDVDGVVTLMGSPVEPTNPHMYFAEQLGTKPLGYIDIGICQGGLAKAAAAISAGMCEVVVYVWGQSGFRIGPGGTPKPQKAPRVAEWSHTVWGAYMTAWYAIWAQRYMHEFGATSEQLAEVAVAARYHATLNPASIMGKRGPISVEDVVTSRMIAHPLHLLDCSIDNDGGYALVVTSAERARSLKKKPVYILGGSEASHTDAYINIEKPWYPKEGYSVKRTADRAFEMAGVTRGDIDYGGLYDCFTITTIRDLEEMGFCKLGEGADFIQGGTIRLGGKLPLNTDGGLLSHSHNGNPAGMHAVETVKQLRGECGDRQVEGCELAVSLGQGYAVHGRAGTVIMSTE